MTWHFTRQAWKRCGVSSRSINERPDLWEHWGRKAKGIQRRPKAPRNYQEYFFGDIFCLPKMMSFWGFCHNAYLHLKIGGRFHLKWGILRGSTHLDPDLRWRCGCWRRWVEENHGKWGQSGALQCLDAMGCHGDSLGCHAAGRIGKPPATVAVAFMVDQTPATGWITPHYATLRHVAIIVIDTLTKRDVLRRGLGRSGGWWWTRLRLCLVPIWVPISENTTDSSPVKVLPWEMKQPLCHGEKRGTEMWLQEGLIRHLVPTYPTYSHWHQH